MLSISTETELSIYRLDGKWNDYIGVQKEVISVLTQLDFFANKDITNVETGMVVRITARGIKETIGNGKILEDDVENYHASYGDKFAYFIAPILIDEIIHNIRIVVRKKINSNHFYIHHIDTEKVPNYSAHLKRR